MLAETQVLKLCECGCGKPTTIVKYDIVKEKVRKGEYRRFIKGHHNRIMKQGYKRGWFKHKGYIYVLSPGHPFPTQGNYVLRSRLVMEEKLGRYLKPRTEHVHHINQVTDDDRPGNLELTNQVKHNRTHKKAEKAREAWRGNHHTAETKKILSNLHRGKKLSAEHKEKISEGLRRRFGNAS